jgi:hypothetical protein
MPVRNYGILNYGRSAKNPKPKTAVKYLAKMFDLETTDRVLKVLQSLPDIQDILKKMGDMGVSTMAEMVRAIFLERQLIEHGRDRLTANYDLSDYQSNTLADIARTFCIKREQEQQQMDKAYQESYLSDHTGAPFEKYKEIRQKYQAQARADDEMRSNYRTSLKKSMNGHPKAKRINNPYKKKPNDPQKQVSKSEIEKTAGKAIEKMLNDTKHEKNQGLVDNIKDCIDTPYAQHQYKMIRTMQANDNTEYDNVRHGVDSESVMIQYRDRTGEYKNLPLQNTLKRILDEIIGQAEIRSAERGFNRPSRFSHFIKGCFLPVYRCNKPRRRPVFYIDASGSMQERRGYFNCITSAVSAFLYSQHRRISEMRPKYYAFRANMAERFDIAKVLPTADGGTNLQFLANVNPKDNNIVITDACFTHMDLAVIRLWAQDNPNAIVHWIVNDETMYNQLKTTLVGFPSQKTYYTQF